MDAHVDPIRLLTAWGVAAALVLGMVVAVAPSPVQAARAMTFDVDLGSSCVSGRAGNRAKVAVTWKDDDGTLKQKGFVKSSRKGYWSYCGDSSERVEKADTIKAKVGSRSRTVTVPNLKLTADRVTDSVAGKGPDNASIKLTACRYTTFLKVKCLDATVATNGNGRFSHDFSAALNLVGRDYAFFTVANGKGDRFGRFSYFPFINVIRGKSRFWGYFKPFKKLTVELHRNGGQLDEWTGRADLWDWGNYLGRFAEEGSDGDTYRVRTGDRVVVPNAAVNADWVVPAVAATVNKKTDVVKGTCGGPSRLFQVFAKSPNGARSGSKSGRTSNSGTFSRDMTKKFDIKTGSIIWINCVLPSGDMVSRRVVAN